MSKLLTESSQANVELLQQLKFRLDPDVKAMLPISQITEVLKLQLVQIMPIPQMPAWVMGVYNWRGDILWMVDLGQLLGLDSWYQHQHERISHTAIVLSPNRQDKQNEAQIHLGLAIAEVEDLAVCDPKSIQAADSQANSRLSEFLQGYWLQPEGSMVFALDGKAIAKAMPSLNP